ncbi:MAG: hypothetical protein JKY27_02850 [Magnetovibrio sp.]|nr:hypothetical protein [Magnetovibrio sp.]
MGLAFIAAAGGISGLDRLNRTPGFIIDDAQGWNIRNDAFVFRVKA